MKSLFLYLIIANLIVFFLFGIDKWKAKVHHWRIPESALLLSALIGGSLGALAGMMLFRHKTKHTKFTIGIPLIIALQVTLLIWFQHSGMPT